MQDRKNLYPPEVQSYTKRSVQVAPVVYSPAIMQRLNTPRNHACSPTFPKPYLCLLMGLNTY